DLTMATRATPISLQNAIGDAYLRYYDTAYWLRDSQLQAERRALLEAEGAVFREPLLEPVLPYDGVMPLADTCAEAGLPDDVAPRLGRMLFGADESFRLRPHQARALTQSLRPTDGKPHVVITSGTGSGKTESFLLPVLARLLAEGRDWP